MPKQPEEKHGIFEKPLPELLDGIEKAAAEARKAADDARAAGEQAANDVMRKLRKLFLKMSHDITEELDETKK